MTLCVAWKENSNIHFASDSRLTLTKYNEKNDAIKFPVDCAIKVISIPYKLQNVTTKIIDREGEIGMCIAGEAISALFIKETFTEILKFLQYIPDQADLSFDNIAKIIFLVYEKISKEINSFLYKKGISVMFIAGKLDYDEEIKCYKIGTEPSSNNQFMIEALTNDYEFFGSGQVNAEKIFKENYNSVVNRNNLLCVLQEVIDNEDIKEVGGDIQYGRFEDNKFRICGIIKHKDDGTVEYKRGLIDLNSSDYQMRDGNDFFLSFEYLVKEF